MKRILPIVIAFLVLIPIVPFGTDANSPPEKPTLSGTADGETGSTYTYTATSTDPDGDDLFYCFDWGDGNEFCTQLMSSGDHYQASHAWQSDGTYTVSVTATDENGAVSEPATMRVTMPLSYTGDLLTIDKPKFGLYLFGIRVFPLPFNIVLGDVKVQVDADPSIERVEFMLNMACGCGREVMHVDTTPPFEWDWNQDYNDDEIIDEGYVQLMVRGYSSTNEYRDSIGLIKVKF